MGEKTLMGMLISHQCNRLLFKRNSNSRGYFSKLEILNFKTQISSNIHQFICIVRETCNKTTHFPESSKLVQNIY